MNIVCLDVDYRVDQASTGWVLFQDWGAETASQEGQVLQAGVAPYQPGAFYLRELPPLLHALERLPTVPTGIVVDGFCWLGPERPGLGVHLWEALGRRGWVVGVAKTPFQGHPGLPVVRGNTTKPLWVTACGVEAQWAAERVQSMHGPYRMPTLLKRVDQLARS